MKVLLTCLILCTTLSSLSVSYYYKLQCLLHDKYLKVVSQLVFLLTIEPYVPVAWTEFIRHCQDTLRMANEMGQIEP